MRNIQVIDGADTCTFLVFQATVEEFAAVFPGPEQDMQFAEDLDEQALKALAAIWDRPIPGGDSNSIHGTLFHGFGEKRRQFPETKRMRDWDPASLNGAQRRFFETVG
jgi:hypothetical protein